ncbi:MAG: hypothetical protein OXG60_11770 [Chloroflexi bacterium]|nr:hypothetical protein [Chloroflexota bacterium]
MDDRRPSPKNNTSRPGFEDHDANLNAFYESVHSLIEGIEPLIEKDTDVAKALSSTAKALLHLRAVIVHDTGRDNKVQSGINKLRKELHDLVEEVASDYTEHQSGELKRRYDDTISKLSNRLESIADSLDENKG